MGTGIKPGGRSHGDRGTPLLSPRAAAALPHRVPGSAPPAQLPLLSSPYIPNKHLLPVSALWSSELINIPSVPTQPIPVFFHGSSILQCFTLNSEVNVKVNSPDKHCWVFSWLQHHRWGCEKPPHPSYVHH